MPTHPDRALPLHGVSNFRDLGGYPARDGQRVRWRRLFRSAHLGGATEADRAALAQLGLTRAFDFRGVAERAATPNSLAGALANVRQHSLAIEPSVEQRVRQCATAGRRVDAALMVELMNELYRGLVTTQAPRFAELFDHLLHDDAPLVFHCTAGKDRTGVAAALILLALGVPRATVVEDYLLTTRHYRRPAPAPGSAIPPDAQAVLWGVQAQFLDAALDLIDAEHGGIEPYLRQRLGLSAAALEALAGRYLEPATAAARAPA